MILQEQTYKNIIHINSSNSRDFRTNALKKLIVDDSGLRQQMHYKS